LKKDLYRDLEKEFKQTLRRCLSDNMLIVWFLELMLNL